jgi:HEAT repeat protein
VGQLGSWVRADPDPRVRAAALGALVRAAGAATARAAWRDAAVDPDPAVRRRAAELAPALGPTTARPLVRLLGDADVIVTETAAWGLGELGPVPRSGATRALARVARDHPDALAREAAVAALGALADPAGLPAILAACGDKPPVRRRAVLALAPFDGPAVTAALEHALTDRDWQTRQAAEDLLDHS